MCPGYYLPPTNRPALDNVKIAVEGEENRERFYFARCVAFLQDDDDNVFVALRWYSEKIPGSAIDLVVMLPPLTLEPETLTKSYSIMPAHAIVNGALIIPRKDAFYAMLSPREEEQYLLKNSY